MDGEVVSIEKDAAGIKSGTVRIHGSDRRLCLWRDAIEALCTVITGAHADPAATRGLARSILLAVNGPCAGAYRADVLELLGDSAAAVEALYAAGEENSRE